MLFTLQYYQGRIFNNNKKNYKILNHFRLIKKIFDL